MSGPGLGAAVVVPRYAGPRPTDREPSRQCWPMAVGGGRAVPAPRSGPVRRAAERGSSGRPRLLWEVAAHANDGSAARAGGLPGGSCRSSRGTSQRLCGSAPAMA